MSNPTEGIPVIHVTVSWDRTNGDFDSTVIGDSAGVVGLVAVIVQDRETGEVHYANNVADPDEEDTR